MIIVEMGLRFENQNLGQCFFVTTSYYEHQAYGLVSGVYEALADSCRYYMHKYNAKLAGYVFMPTHIHLLIIVDGEKLADFMRDFKKYVAQKAMKDLGITSHRIWASGYDRQAIYTEKVFRTKLDYIHNNPVKGGLVSTREKWSWSSAVDYFTDRKGEIEVWREWMF